MPDRPELMAIGDSIYNGTRSLTTNASLARLSAPAQVARAFGWDFTTPAYPFDVLFDLEALFRADSFDLDTLKASVIANAQGWLDRARWADDDCFDNIAIAQATIGDLSSFTYLNHVSQIEPLVARLRRASDIDFAALVGLYEAINTAFVLNPRRDPASRWADRTPLEIVAERRPRRLLIDIGINDGIWTVCLEAIKTEFDPAAIATAMHDLGERLAGMKAAGQVDTIYLNLLPKASCIANLMPRHDPDRPPGGTGYFPEYFGRLGQLGGLTAGDMQAIDQEIVALNHGIADDLGEMFPDGGLALVDTYAMVAARDDKHFRDSRPIRVRDWRLNNVPLQGFSHKGGLYGLDNLHPTTVGYAVLAQAVCEKIVVTEGIKPVQPIDFEAAFDSDSLLTDIPRMLDLDNLLINLAVAFIRAAERPSA
jgi:lysophospholipase L1-like esterase